MAKRNNHAPDWRDLTDTQREHAIDFLRVQGRYLAGAALSEAVDSLANLGEDTTGTLTYWVADCLDDRPAYSIRARTRRECEELRQRDGGASAYDKPRKVTIQYRDAFDLARRLLGEGGAEG